MGDCKGLRSIYRSEHRRKARDDQVGEPPDDKGKRPMDLDKDEEEDDPDKNP